MALMAAVVGKADTARSKNLALLTEAHHALQRNGSMTGQLRSYRSFLDGPEHQRPSENKRVEATAEELLEKSRTLWIDMWDAVATRDYANAGEGAPAADVIVNGEVLIEKAPVPFLLWMLKELDKVETFVRKVPTHPAASEWTRLEDRGVWASTPVEALLTQQETVPLVIVPPTDKHPAQATTTQETVTKGVWTTQALSGGIPVNQRDDMLRRILRLRMALEAAKDNANRVDVNEVHVAGRVVSYLFD